MKYLSVLLLLSLFSQIANDSLAQIDENKGNDKFVILFKNQPNIDNYFYFTKTHWTRDDRIISFIDNNAVERIELDLKKEQKSLSRPVNGKYFLLAHKFNFLDNSEYLFRKGDTILIEYIDKKPKISLQNRSTPKGEFMFDELVREKYGKYAYYPIGKYFGALYLNGRRRLSSKNDSTTQSKINPEQRFKKIKEEVIQIKKDMSDSVKTYLSLEKRVLDSLESKHLISEISIDYYRSRHTYLNQIVDIENEKIVRSEITSVLDKHRNNQGGYQNYYHKKLLESIAEKYFVNNAPYLDLGDGVNRDNRTIFSQIDTSSLFSEKDKNYLLTRELNRIHRSFSHEDFIEYFGKYQLSVKDSALANQAKRDFALEFDSSRSETGSIVLTGQGGEKLTFEDLKKRHKGKIIYVDFWASWCGPCREAMPASASLRKELEGKNVVFVYLSIDNNVSPWRVASAKEELNNLKDNFLVVNHRTSEFFKKYKLNEIPRYMIFDKTGNLINANAPRVESSEIGLLLTRLADKP